MNLASLFVCILIACIIVFLPIVVNSKVIENFYVGYIPHLRYPYYFRYPYSRYPLSNDSLWWNATRSTRNMSYDLRGDVPIPMTYVGPWNISSYAPVVNKSLWLVS